MFAAAQGGKKARRAPEAEVSSSVCTQKETRAETDRPSAELLEQVKGVEPSSSAWKADVLAVVRHLRGIADVFYYTRGNTDCQGLFQRVESLECSKELKV